MLNEEVAKYRELSGDTNPNTPISRIGGYLDGYEKALEQSSYNSIKTELNGDLISRQAVLNKILKFSVTDGRSISVSGLWTEVNDLPSVTPQEPTTKNDLTLIHTEGLDEEIRCTMCANSMKSDRGCDGGCVVNKDMYKKVMDAIERRIQKTGHWILSDDGLYRPICDNCGAHPWKGYIPTVEEATKVFKYCPNCGYRMIEPQESEET